LGAVYMHMTQQPVITTICNVTSIGKMASNLTSSTSRSTTHMDYIGHVILDNYDKSNWLAHSFCFPIIYQQETGWNWTWTQRGIGIHIDYNKAKGSNELASTSLSSYFLETNSYFVGVVAIHAMKS